VVKPVYLESELLPVKSIYSVGKHFKHIHSWEKNIQELRREEYPMRCRTKERRISKDV